MSCIHIYFGEQRQGKTLYMVLQAQLVAYDKSRLNNCYNRIDAYNAMGYKFSKPKHLVLADFDIELHHFGKQPEMNYWCNGFYLGMPRVVTSERKIGIVKQQVVTYRTMFLAPGMSIFLDEGNKYFNSRDRDIMPGWRSRFIELMGQYGLEMHMVCHRPELVDSNVRDLADFREFVGVDIAYDAIGRICTMTINSRYFANNKDVEQYLKTGILPSYSKIEQTVIDCRVPCFDIGKYYDTHFFDKAFLKDAENKDFDLIQKKHTCYTIEDVQKFNKEFDYKVPKGLRGE